MTMQSGTADRTAVSPVGPVFIALYALAMFGIWMAINLPASVTLALRISEIDPAGKTTSYSIAAGVGTLTALLANPFFGRLSDRTRSRFGRRRPWIVIGMLGTAAGAAVIGFSDSFALLLVGWVLMQAFVNAAVAAMLAIVADRVPESQQGVIGSLSGAASAASLVIGIFVIQAFPTSILAQIGLPVAVALVLAGALIAVFRDDVPAAEPLPHFGVREFLGSFVIDPRREREFSWLLLSLFFMFGAWGVVSTYTVYLLQDMVAVPEGELSTVITLSYVIPGVLAFLAGPVAGFVGDRLGRRKPVLAVGAIISAAGMVVIATASTGVQFLIGAALVSGIGSGVLLGTYIAFGIATMRETTDAARNLGVINIAITLPFSVIPFIAPLVLGIGGGSSNYVALVLVGGLFALLGTLPLLRIRSTR
ncbi:MFS transporter [Rathayibacter sp. VKM Ac-2760]|uniref:MFS transporter n=1 Tax=Rathayibacter sp. VKM Ac-2760 TaxID=2609253 RepID=UPI001317C0F0|nr:MFS transporter [Rathayibacter sp. VKM Ac-2760]QHC58753.1 MFS transporter [Rathayibacter sp. VKM Ac-2760]